MTQNIAQVVSDTLDAVSGEDAGTMKHSRIRRADTRLSVVGFGLDAIVAVIGYQHGSFWALPISIHLLVTFVLRAGPGKCAVGE